MDGIGGGGWYAVRHLLPLADRHGMAGGVPMTRREIEAIAAAIGRANPIVSPSDRIGMVNTRRAVAAAIAETNPGFDEGYFITAVEAAASQLSIDLLGAGA